MRTPTPTSMAATCLNPNSTLEQLLLANCTEAIPVQYQGLRLHYHSDIWTAAVIQRVVMLVFIMVMTFVGNVTIILVLTCSRYRKLNSRVNIFIINLAIGDLSVFLFTMTTELLFVAFEGAWVVGAVACKVLLYAQIVTLASTTFILAAMSFDRYMAICRPLSFGSSSRARKMIVVSWLMAFIFASPQLLIFKQNAVGVYPNGEIFYKCQSKGYTAWWQRKLYFTFMTSYILVIPAIFISFCYINVVKVVWRQGTDGDSLREGISLRKSMADKRAIPRAKIKTIKMTLSIICSFIACWTPYFVVHLIHIWSEYTYSIPEFVYAFAETMALLNSAVNPILYGCFNIKMKRGLSELFCPNRTRDKNAFMAASSTGRSQVRSTVGRTVRSAVPDSMSVLHPDINSSSDNEARDLVTSKSKDNIIKEENLNGFRLRVRFSHSKSPMQLRNLLGEGRSDSDCEDSHV